MDTLWKLPSQTVIRIIQILIHLSCQKPQIPVDQSQMHLKSNLNPEAYLTTYNQHPSMSSKTKPTHRTPKVHYESQNQTVIDWNLLSFKASSVRKLPNMFQLT